MKRISLILAGLFLFAFSFTSCEKQEDELTSSTLPENFKVDIPSSLSNSTAPTANKVDEMGGDEIYENLTFFIHVGEDAAELVQEIIRSIRGNNLSQAMSFSYVSDDDGRTKNVVITENSSFEGETWEYQLTITDAESEGNEDGGYAMQVFWNANPVKGIAILKPYNIDRSDSEDLWSQAIFRIDYSEAGEYGYGQSMIVYIDELPTPSGDVFAMSEMKMFVGKTGDIVDVYGNSAHPNAIMFNSEAGFDWAFVASGSESTDLAVAEVGLPPYLLDESSRTVLLEDYSVLNVFTELIQSWYWDNYGIQIDDLTLAAYLENAQAPGFFNQDGFIGSGTAPSDDFQELLTNINAMAPYNPFEIANMEIQFKSEDVPVK